MDAIWTGMLGFSLLCAILSGQTHDLASAVLHGAQAGIQLVLSLSGPFCLWNGLSAVMHASGFSEFLARLFHPLLQFMFPRAFADSQARHALCGNFTANLLGLGNAATPMGIAAVRRMQQLSGSENATHEMCRLIVLNTASVQLIPTTVATLRAELNAAAPMDILPAVWVTSVCSVTIGLLAAWGFSKCFP